MFVSRGAAATAAAFALVARCEQTFFLKLRFVSATVIGICQSASRSNAGSTWQRLWVPLAHVALSASS